MEPADRPPPDLGRGPWRPRGAAAERFVHRVRRLDRRERFSRRLEEVLRDQERHRRRRRIALALTLSGAFGTAIAVGLLLASLPGMGIGIGAVTVALLGDVGVRHLARRRGAAAWDWRAGRYRLFGRPAWRVHELDQPRDRGPGR